MGYFFGLLLLECFLGDILEELIIVGFKNLCMQGWYDCRNGILLLYRIGVGLKVGMFMCDGLGRYGEVRELEGNKLGL